VISSSVEALCRLSLTHSRLLCSGPQARLRPGRDVRAGVRVGTRGFRVPQPVQPAPCCRSKLTSAACLHSMSDEPWVEVVAGSAIGRDRMAGNWSAGRVIVIRASSPGQAASCIAWCIFALAMKRRRSRAQRHRVRKGTDPGCQVHRRNSSSTLTWGRVRTCHWNPPKPKAQWLLEALTDLELFL
jgi:hypothetical protein